MSENQKIIGGKGYTYTVTRRIVQRSDSTVLRVRVQTRKSFTEDLVKDDHRDYTSVFEGDQAFNRIVGQIRSRVSN